MSACAHTAFHVSTYKQVMSTTKLCEPKALRVTHRLYGYVHARKHCKSWTHDQLSESNAIYGYVHACKHCKPWVNSDACQFCIAQHEVSRIHVHVHANMYSVCTCQQHVWTKAVDDQDSEVRNVYTRQYPSNATSVYTYKVICNYMSALHVCTCHKRPCIVLCRQSTNSMVHASVCTHRHTCQCIHVSLCVVDLYQIVRSKSSVSLNHSSYGHVHEYG